MNYKDAGVDVEAGYKSVELIKKHVQSTFDKNVLDDIGGFGGLYEISKALYKQPVLVSGTDGVGTKLKIAFMMDKHDTIGIDCVAMCVNDIICSGAKPLFFLDYLAVSKNIPEKIEEIVKGVANGCRQAGCSLVGGETAEMPGLYKKGEYDLAGFAVGIVDKSKIIDGRKIKQGDTLIGLQSSGFHSNGFSLIRNMFDLNLNNVKEKSGISNFSLGELLLEPTKIYVKSINNVLEKFEINGISNITGGGFYENVPRMSPKNDFNFVIYKNSWEKPAVFSILDQFKNISQDELYKTFNMGIGMVIAVNREIADNIISSFNEIGENAYKIGEVKGGKKGVSLC